MISQLFVICFHLFGFLLLMQGLFPYSSSINNINNRSCFDSQESSKHHVIIMLIDALRADYVFNKNHSYVLKSIEKFEEKGKVLSYKLRSHSPTVTLPRLKALLTGTIPSFWDIIFNYNSSKLELDNLLFQYKRKYPENKIIFYGDDTWIKLFPNDIFYRSKGLQSFFVTDFKEIDLNVTDGLYEELNRMNDWNLLIVHYLGLDHIGHAYGAFNSFIQDKLIEYDQIIENILLKMTKNDILIITGDHGMADKGGHGGSSYAETYVPAIFISHQFKETKYSNSMNEEYLQIDLTPTLSALLEISIPSNNLGILIENILEKFYQKTKPNLLKCLINDNERQLYSLLSNKKLSIYSNNLKLIRDQAMLISNQQDLIILLLSITLFFSSTILLWFNIEIKSFLSIIILILLYTITRKLLISLSIYAICFCFIVIRMNKTKQIHYKLKYENKISNLFLIFYPLLHLISLFSSSFIEEEHQIWYYFLSTYLLLKTIETKSFKILIIFILSRFIRSWNQTGNKWLNLKDVGDFLNQSENGNILILVHVISSIIFIYLVNKPRQYSISYLLPLIVIIYRWNLIGDLSSLTPLLYYALIALLMIVNRFSLETFLFSLLYILCRSHNSVIIIVHMISYRFINENDARVLFLFSQSAFYHLGNSNSFVTIDISSGFVGIPIYIPIIHGIFIYLSTYGLSIIWLLKLSKNEQIIYLIQMTLINCIFSLCIFIQRYHLFIWTVFAPKLVYLCAQTAFHLFLFFMIK
ncbi:unnamed protein product [Rotaria socialis]|uniref:GPI ethanolamine phosphate transferase 2 n=1 Tax=Rotaria socialis TaxID=392032 RepID=A0A817VCJ8_9BILA|nr:unnamed protein product [Rotaria socialis]CAF3358288.1 unnamed protein product [Rotaria socialis]CAF3469650.1 unnamed protein product [Rotaria socialis]CAF3516712.1 unnamed protein product [Rotaria socialis]CAF3662066.1 unnamed protein product [Rotaria socialis]